MAQVQWALRALLEVPKVSRATHNIFAYRLWDAERGVQVSFFLFFLHVSLVVRLTPQEQSAEPKNSASAEVLTVARMGGVPRDYGIRYTTQATHNIFAYRLWDAERGVLFVSCCVLGGSSS